MGASCSTNNHATPACNSALASFSQEEALAYPSWCLAEQDTSPLVTSVISDTWQVLLQGETKPFLEARRMTPTLSPIVFFHDKLFSTFFQLSPESKSLFKRGHRSQARMFAHVVRFVCNNMEKGEEFEAMMKYLAVWHNHMNLKPEDFSTFGICMLVAVRDCLGDDIYTPEVKYAWTAMYSRVMQIFIPVVVRRELKYDAGVIEKKNIYDETATLQTSSIGTSVSRNSGSGQRSQPEIRLGAAIRERSAAAPVETELVFQLDEQRRAKAQVDAEPSYSKEQAGATISNKMDNYSGVRGSEKWISTGLGMVEKTSRPSSPVSYSRTAKEVSLSFSEI